VQQTDKRRVYYFRKEKELLLKRGREWRERTTYKTENNGVWRKKKNKRKEEKRR
jgi:hypothetical protein